MAGGIPAMVILGGWLSATFDADPATVPNDTVAILAAGALAHSIFSKDADK